MTDYVTPTTWEQCAAHVEAGGVVEIEDAPGVWINDRAATTIYRGRCGTPDDGWAPRRLVPIESAAAPAAGDDLRERIARTIWEDDERAKRDQLNDWRAEPLTDHEVYLRNADAVLAVLSPQPAPSPVPPWPGAVLSGLVDEDGEPTWLAQAGQVRGEPIRCSRNLSWTKTWGYGPGMWVEVRAPRAVAEPATERVPWWEARDRLGLAGDPFVEVGADDEGPWVRVVEGGTKLHSPVDPDGTVEVLKDGER